MDIKKKLEAEVLGTFWLVLAAAAARSLQRTSRGWASACWACRWHSASQC